MDLVNEVADTYLRTASGSEAARLRFLQGVWEIQSSIEGVDRPYNAPSEDAARDAFATGKPLFFLSAPEVPLAEYLEAVSRLAGYTSSTAGLPADQAEALRVADFASAIDAEGLAAAALSPQVLVLDVCAGMGAQPGGPLTPATIAFVLVSALVPFLTRSSRKALHAVGDQGSGAHGTGRCPVCGADAAMGRVGESTQLQGAERTLWCGVCHAEWGYERLRCVRCGCRNPEKLRYTNVEGDSAHRVHLCDECHGYARFVFEGDLGKPLSMVVEDAVTAKLDAIAVESGYAVTGDGGSGSC